jgi:acyl-CoA reductase-like NAD-dependent aldehyde dehydrogenase
MSGSPITRSTDSRSGLHRRLRARTGDRAPNRYRFVRCQSVMISVEAPYNGAKLSGQGRELGPESLNSYTQVKSIYA